MPRESVNMATVSSGYDLPILALSKMVTSINTNKLWRCYELSPHTNRVWQQLWSNQPSLPTVRIRAYKTPATRCDAVEAICKFNAVIMMMERLSVKSNI